MEATVVGPDPRSPPVVTAQHVEFEPEILREADKARSLLLDPQQRVDADGVSRDELVEFENGLRWLRASGKQVGNVYLAKAASEANDHSRRLASALDSAKHAVDKRKT